MMSRDATWEEGVKLTLGLAFMGGVMVAGAVFDVTLGAMGYSLKSTVPAVVRGAADGVLACGGVGCTVLAGLIAGVNR